MNSSGTWKQFPFYVWTGLGYMSIWWLNNLSNNPETFFQRAINDLWRVIYVIVLNFVFYEYVIPFFRLKWQRILLGILIVWVMLMLYSYGSYGWRTLGIKLGIYTEYKTFESLDEGVSYFMGYSVGSIVFFGLIRHIFHHIKLRQSAQQLRIEKQAAELNYLRSQTNPHFLFNTLNNIYSLARDKSNLAPESILRLSKILRFMLYETSGTYIAIEKELKIITDYIALERLRYDESLRINFNYDVEDMKQAIQPLLLIPLVENAFKHGVSETRNQPYVDIHLSVHNRLLTFIVRNSTEDALVSDSVKENIGLSNLRRQLELLYREYDLKVQQKQHEFTATLKINLASHVKN